MSKVSRTVAVAVGVFVFVSALLGAQTGTAAGGATPAGTARTGWGEPDLTGVWLAPKLGARSGQDTFNLRQLERLYRPEGRAKMTKLSAQDDPTLHCVPPAFPRAAMLGWPIQIIQTPGFLTVFNEAFHTFRIIPTNGRKHLGPDFLYPVYFGDPTGHWEGETLVVDVLSFNGETWLAGAEDKPTTTSRGVWPTSDAQHIVERWRRVDADTLEYQARVEDPQMLTGPWETPKVIFRRQPLDRIDEVKCMVKPLKSASGGTFPPVPPAAYLNQFGR